MLTAVLWHSSCCVLSVLLGFFQAKATAKTRYSSPPPKKKCPSCKATLRDSWTKPLCKAFIADLVRLHHLLIQLSVVSFSPLFKRSCQIAFQCFRSYLDKRPGVQPSSQRNLPSSPLPSALVSREVSVSESHMERIDKDKTSS